MKKLLLAPLTAALTALTAVAHADVMSITLSETGFAPVTFFGALGAPSVSVTAGTSYGNFQFNSIDAVASPLEPSPTELVTNTLNISSTGAANPLVIDIKAASIADLPGAGTPLDSFFSVTGITSGWTMIGETLLDGTPLVTTPLIGSNFAQHFGAVGSLTGLDTFEAIYTINTHGAAGGFNGGIDIAAVPGPTVGSIGPALVQVVKYIGKLLN